MKGGSVGRSSGITSGICACEETLAPAYNTSASAHVAASELAHGNNAGSVSDPESCGASCLASALYPPLRFMWARVVHRTVWQNASSPPSGGSRRSGSKLNS